MTDFLIDKILPVFFTILTSLVILLVVISIPHFIKGDVYCEKNLIISERQNNYDVNNDGKVDSLDLLLIKKYLLAEDKKQ